MKKLAGIFAGWPGNAASIFLIATLLVTASCGWHLRGAGMIPESLKILHISAQNPDSLLARDLGRTLRSAGVSVPDSAADAELSLMILDEHSQTRTATVNENARVSEQQITETARFMVIDRSGAQLIPATTVSVERIFDYNEDNVLATQDEGALIRAEMRRDLISQILNRLRQLRNKSNATAP